MREKAMGQRRNRSMNYLAIVVAAGAAFVASALWYTVFGKAMMELSRAADTGASVWTMLFIIAQSLIIAFMIAYFVSRLGITDFASAAGLGALLWIFPAAILLGSVVHEGVPLALAAIHAGDWLVKLLLIGVVVGLWR
jgi:hypothetical protein